LQELPFKQGDKVKCFGFEGKLYSGTVIECKWIDAGYTKFILVRARLNKFGNEIRINWSLFPDRVFHQRKENE
jgi:hypothetical protein